MTKASDSSRDREAEAVVYAVRALERQQLRARKDGYYPKRVRLSRRQIALQNEEDRASNTDGKNSKGAQVQDASNEPRSARDVARARIYGVGIAKSRTGTGPHPWDPQPLGRVVKRMTRRFGWNQTLSVASIVNRWPEIIGNVNAEHCKVEDFTDKVLVIRTTSTAWANQMRLLLPHVERRVTEELGEGAVDRVIIRGPATPSWKKGRLSVPGRGPRDTYG